jgi:hypothetical protein
LSGCPTRPPPTPPRFSHGYADPMPYRSGSGTTSARAATSAGNPAEYHRVVDRPTKAECGLRCPAGGRVMQTAGAASSVSAAAKDAAESEAWLRAPYSREASTANVPFRVIARARMWRIPLPVAAHRDGHGGCAGTGVADSCCRRTHRCSVRRATAAPALSVNSIEPLAEAPRAGRERTSPDACHCWLRQIRCPSAGRAVGAIVRGCSWACGAVPPPTMTCL